MGSLDSNEIIQMIQFPRCLLIPATLLFIMGEGRAQSQSEMNQKEYAIYEKADAALNKIYLQVLSKLDDEGKAKLKVAQRAWVVFRDAQAELDADIMRGGSAAPLLRAGSLTGTTRHRTDELKQLLNQHSDP